MNKELTLLKESTLLEELRSARAKSNANINIIKNFYETSQNVEPYINNPNEELDIIEKSLKELEEYKTQDIKVCGGSLLTCKTDFETLWKEHKALEIIKNVVRKNSILNKLNEWLKIGAIDKDKYDLLKDVFVNHDD